MAPNSIDSLILRVAVAAPCYNLFDYLPPEIGLGDVPLVRGLRLRIPFSNSKRLGVLWDVAQVSQCATTMLKAALEWIDTTPLWSMQDLDLLAWTAGYYHYPLGEVLELALPTRLRHNTLTKLSRPTQSTSWRLTPAGQLAAPGARALRQQQLLELLRTHPDGLSLQAICNHIPNPRPHIRHFTALGWIIPCTTHLSPAILQPGPNLNSDQTTAVLAVAEAMGKFKAFLLVGVTGSGKTEVYLHLIEKVLNQGKQVLVLVPEIGLTPQMLQLLTQRFNVRIALLHSTRSEAKREEDWLAAQTGLAAIILGTRLAVFTPIPKLALIIVDEEHDPSFKQQEGLRYSARDIAVWRAKQCGCPVVLGSATPSLESLNNTIQGRYTRLNLPVRAGIATSPSLELIDTRSVRLKAGLSPALIQLLRENVAAGQQSLLFLNRRGYAPLLTCYTCGWAASCCQCDARLTLHQNAGILWCHHCGIQQPQIKVCPACSNANLKPIGQGTQRLEQTLSELFGDISIARIDSDSTTHCGSLERLINEIKSGQHLILLGTQMLAKGHHFPGVTLVGILNLDQGLYGVDFRASERMAQLLIQVAGRSGRESKPGRVVLQTRYPDHQLLQTLVKRGYDAFATIVLQERQQTSLPPFSAQALLRADGKDAERVTAFLQAATTALVPLPSAIELWGPAPAPMERRAGRYRYNLLIQALNRSTLHGFLDKWVTQLSSIPKSYQISWSLDVDPQDLL